jgi:cytochrome P450
MGAPMARLEARLAFEKLLARFPRIELEDDAPDYRPNPILRGLRRLDLSLG